MPYNELTGEFDALPPVPSFVGKHIRFVCPLINLGKWLLALLAYPQGKRVTFELQLSPVTCQTAINGSVVRIASQGESTLGQRLLAELQRLTA
jgi:hypothetical protein